MPTFNLNTHELCPLKDVCRNFKSYDEATRQKGSQMEKKTLEEFGAGFGLTMADGDKLRVLSQGDNNEYYCVDDSGCEGPEIVRHEFSGSITVACGAVIVAKETK